jgi:hypothetical protein
MKTEYQERESRFLEMIRTCRPDMSKAHAAFCAKYLEPVFGPPDLAGNYTLDIGANPRAMFAAHSDTVHSVGGNQKIQVSGGMVRLHPKAKSNCLGADCTTGVHIILEMIRANVPGRYAIFATEEIGCIGSRDYVKRRADELAGIEFVISLDRKGYNSIITHQMGRRTASDSFAFNLAGILDLDLTPDPTGSYTDSNEFARHVSECTNVSVGYFGQHGPGEYQDLAFLGKLTERMIRADWSQLKAFRDHTVTEFDDWPLTVSKGKKSAGKKAGYSSGQSWREFMRDFDPWETGPMSMRELVRDYPHAIADWLEDQGLNANDLCNELGISNGTRGGYGNGY